MQVNVHVHVDTCTCTCTMCTLVKSRLNDVAQNVTYNCDWGKTQNVTTVNLSKSENQTTNLAIIVQTLSSSEVSVGLKCFGE